jgi:Domain of unknown function (DUF4806)
MNRIEYLLKTLSKESEALAITPANSAHILSRYSISFPVDDVEEFKRIDMLAQKNERVRNALMQYFVQFRPEVTNHGEIVSDKQKNGIPMVIGDNLWFKFNWRGLRGKLAMSSWFLFKKVVFGEIFGF